MAAAILLVAVTHAQDVQQPKPQAAEIRTVTGKIAAINGNSLTLKPEPGLVLKTSTSSPQPVKFDRGTTFEIITTSQTRIVIPGHRPVTLADVKLGDDVIAIGKLDTSNKTLHAVSIVATGSSQANLGVTYITGRVKAIDMNHATITVMRPDKVSQTIGFETTTHFARVGGGSLKPGDLRAGDNVNGIGWVKNGIFVPAQLLVSQSPDIRDMDVSPLNPARP